MSYKVIHKDNEFEIRLYEQYTIAKTLIDDDYNNSSSQGFKILASYIFGANKTKKKIKMTAPVVMKKKQAQWEMNFTIPKNVKFKDLPVPEDKKVAFEEIPMNLVAVVRFSGARTASKNKEQLLKLKDWLEINDEYEEIDEPMYAGYDPPWTAPFLRRNEVLISISKKK